MLSSFIFVSLNLGPRYSSIISDCTARLSSPCYKLQSPLKMCFNQLLETFFAVYGRYLAFFWFFMHQAKLFTGIKKSIDKLILLNTLEYRFARRFFHLEAGTARPTVSGGSSISAHAQAYWGGHSTPIKLAYVGNGICCSKGQGTEAFKRPRNTMFSAEEQGWCHRCAL